MPKKKVAKKVSLHIHKKKKGKPKHLWLGTEGKGEKFSGKKADRIDKTDLILGPLGNLLKKAVTGLQDIEKILPSVAPFIIPHDRLAKVGRMTDELAANIRSKRKKKNKPKRKRSFRR